MATENNTTTAPKPTTLVDLEREVLDLLVINGPTESEYDRLFALVTEIYRTEPVTPADAAVKLRRMLCPVIGMPTGKRADDLLSLGLILEFVERLACPAGDDAELLALWPQYVQTWADINDKAPAHDGPERQAFLDAYHSVDGRIFTTPARTPAGLAVKLRGFMIHHFEDIQPADLDGAISTRHADDRAKRMLYEMLREVEAMACPAPVVLASGDDAELAKLAEGIAVREKAAGAKGVSEDETRRLVVEITGLYGTLATTPAAGLVGVESKLSKVLYFMMESKHAEESEDCAHDVDAVRTSLDTVRRLLGKAA